MWCTYGLSRGGSHGAEPRRSCPSEWWRGYRYQGKRGCVHTGIHDQMPEHVDRTPMHDSISRRLVQSTSQSHGTREENTYVDKSCASSSSVVPSPKHLYKIPLPSPSEVSTLLRKGIERGVWDFIRRKWTDDLRRLGFPGVVFS